MCNFDASIEDAHLIQQIVDRFKLAFPDDRRTGKLGDCFLPRYSR